MFIRFVVSEIDKDSGRELGVYQAIHNLRQRGVLSHYEEEQDEKLVDGLTKIPRNLAGLHLLSPPTIAKKTGRFHGLKIQLTNTSIKSEY